MQSLSECFYPPFDLTAVRLGYLSLCGQGSHPDRQCSNLSLAGDGGFGGGRRVWRDGSGGSPLVVAARAVEKAFTEQTFTVLSFPRTDRGIPVRVLIGFLNDAAASLQEVASG